MDTQKEERFNLLKEIKDEIVTLKGELADLRRRGRYYPVIGEGSHFAKIMFIGEAPGKNEAEQGRPFCGRSGKLLDEMLEAAGVKREEVYITNIVKDRPPLNRDPRPDEIELYSEFLDRQITIIKPEVIITLGRFSMEYIMRKFNLISELGPITKLHGMEFKAIAPYGEISIIPLFHPAVAIYNSNTKDSLKADFLHAVERFKLQ